MRAHGAPHPFADVEHRRLVALALADHDGAVDGDGIETPAHGLDRRLIGGVAITLPHRVGARDRRLFDDAEEIEGEVGVHC